ncbi:MAG: hypothetical protein A2X25_14875 [Chloroflexi bacterium GWB2_49_20]|nr:MAG: hypothetical protein A2X25_14875 [Chloroflexi bacterium GWB2_49_20]OGN77415.1 MAG: hypothetical protein A2X26_07810 [Chloroflexi bacterium GWC2_49_37]OGN84242.1 MAG: hypothetical protein A2X27_12420 [Chloroflexi bacterium GWD2_49_16]HCM96250.1 hypothetical protein [Anaerolineae bacterium]
MDNFEPTPNRSGMIWNIVSILVVVTIIGVVGFFGIIFFNPYSALNPFPPAPLPTLQTYPTATITPLPLPATYTPTITIQPSATETQLPTWTAIPSFTPFLIESAITPPGTQATSSSGMPFEATLTHVGSTYYHPDAGCNWMGVAGQAVDINNSPILYLTIHISGTLGGKFLDYYSLTGTAPNYGQAGFEFMLGDKAIASSNTLWIQLLDQQNLPLTEQIKLTTYNDCTKNLVMIRFKKVR